MIRVEQEIPIVANVEVLVVGGGPGGIAAAIAAARNGCQVLLVERYGFLGGNITAALINPLFTFHDRQGQQVIGGIAEEVVQSLIAQGGSLGHVPDLTFDNASMTPVDPEVAKIALLKMVKDAGVDFLFHSLCTGVIRDGSKIRQVIFATKSGPIAIAAKAVIDCTGDGDLAHLAGIPTHKGREEDGVMQPASTFFRLENVDFSSLKTWMVANREYIKGVPSPAEIQGVPALALLGLTDLIKKAITKGDYPPDGAPRILLYQLPVGNQVAVNVSRLQNIDGTDVFDLTRAEIRGRRQAWEILNFLKKYVGGFEKAYIVETGEIGIRETRRLVGKYTLTEEDVLQGRSFTDGIACGTFAIDIHPPEGKEQVFTGSGKAVYEIPLRSLQAKELTNFLVAGRCISTTHAAHGSTRVMATCLASGQGAGTAIAQARDHNWQVDKIDVAKLRTELIKQGQYLLDERVKRIVNPALKLKRPETDGAGGGHFNPFEN